MLSIEQLEELEDQIREEFNENLTRILTLLNQQGKLDSFLELLGMTNLLHPEPLYRCFPNGKIVVLGESKVSERELLGVAKNLGLDKKRFEFHLEYNDAKSFDCRKMHCEPSYSLVLVGPMPHSGAGKGDASSVITAMENTIGYPPVYRLGTNELKISKSGFRTALEEAIANRDIVI